VGTGTGTDMDMTDTPGAVAAMAMLEGLRATRLGFHASLHP
jgi:hypothetical protein